MLHGHYKVLVTLSRYLTTRKAQRKEYLLDLLALPALSGVLDMESVGNSVIKSLFPNVILLVHVFCSTHQTSSLICPGLVSLTIPSFWLFSCLDFQDHHPYFGVCLFGISANSTTQYLIHSAAFFLLDKVDGYRREFSLEDTSYVVFHSICTLITDSEPIIKGYVIRAFIYYLLNFPLDDLSSILVLLYMNAFRYVEVVFWFLITKFILAWLRISLCT